MSGSNNRLLSWKERGRGWRVCGRFHFVFNADTVSEVDALDTMKHEMVHAYDACMGHSATYVPFIYTDCETVAIQEVRAYCMSGECDLLSGPQDKLAIDPEARKQCVRDRAIRSVESHSECKPGAKWVDQVFANAYIATTPTAPVPWPKPPEPRPNPAPPVPDIPNGPLGPLSFPRE